MRLGSSATSTVGAALAKSRTATDSSRERGAQRWLVLSRAALIAVAVLVCIPSPWGALFGGRTTGSAWPAMAAGVAWASLAWPIGRWEQNREGLGSGALSGWSLVLDVLGLSALLSLSGSAQNPFTLLYFVPITLATVVAPKWTFRIAGLSVVAFTALLVQTAVSLEQHRQHAHHAHFFQHVQGMAIALAVAGGFVTIFVHRIGRALSAQKRRIDELSRERQRDHLAVALGALSAGAAHELGSPLGSIQLLAEELPHLADDERKQALGTIVSEVQRMKAIVHGMGTSELSAELLRQKSEWDVAELEDELDSHDVRLRLSEAIFTTQPKKVVAQMVREVVRNALLATAPGKVAVRANRNGSTFALVIEDEGPGLPPEQLERAMDPFVSFSGGTGLGLFLASVHARQLGGLLSMESDVGRGTRVKLELPLEAPVLIAEGGNA